MCQGSYGIYQCRCSKGYGYVANSGKYQGSFERKNREHPSVREKNRIYRKTNGGNLEVETDG